MELWRIFKSFGKVRDVYLPSKKSLQGICFGFIRFGSVEEAVTVANKVNGMVVDGHRLSAKVSSYGWNRRRSVVSKAQSVKGDVFLPKTRRSFAEVVTGNQRIDEEVLTMEWTHRNNDQD
ncbi:hypothetical protein Dsin_023726 [Dipteronia sinensis]|uniref:RRM domain-containing protein n=1 Tax=Dipteronia sinensis TaxID=43782 RepID=A0AAE0A5B6_9ROSI|nr:hypothetical protein Dsin_023726 [Dipteronia sinensis]